MTTSSCTQKGKTINFSPEKASIGSYQLTSSIQISFSNVWTLFSKLETTVAKLPVHYYSSSHMSILQTRGYLWAHHTTTCIQHKELEMTWTGFLPSRLLHNWNVKCHKFNKDLQLPRFCTLWNNNFVAVHGLDCRSVPHGETQYTYDSRNGRSSSYWGMSGFQKMLPPVF